MKRGINDTRIKFSEKYDYRFLLAILNSKLINWYFINFLSEKLHFYPEDAKNLPIIDTSTIDQKPFVKHVNEILAITKDKDYLTNSTKQTKVANYEKQIDQLVYKLYGLTKEEIKIVENGK